MKDPEAVCKITSKIYITKSGSGRFNGTYIYIMLLLCLPYRL